MNYVNVILAVGFGFTFTIASAQKIDSLDKKKTEPEEIKTPDKWTLLTYIRVIRDASGNVRLDENLVPNIRLSKSFNLELGVRHGEQTFADNSATQLGAYNHYKIELQTKRVKTFRLWTRLSDNIDQSPNQYSRSNYIIGIDGKPKISKSFTAIVAYGYVWSFQKNNQLDAPPITSGTKTNYPIFKIGLQYNLFGKGHIEYTWGTYDVFNPYLLIDPFTQITFDYELSKRVTLYTYFRREYLNNYDVLFNDFFTGGVRIHFGKK